MSSPNSAEVTLAGIPASVPSARRFVRVTLRSWGLEDLADTALLVVSELASNAVLHARSDFTVVLSLRADGTLRLEVLDRSSRRPAQRRHSSGAATGRGLSIVESVALEWGVDKRPDGKAVWVQLEARASSALQDPAQDPPPSAKGPRSQVDPTGPAVRAA